MVRYTMQILYLYRYQCRYRSLYFKVPAFHGYVLYTDLAAYPANPKARFKYQVSDVAELFFKIWNTGIKNRFHIDFWLYCVCTSTVYRIWNFLLFGENQKNQSWAHFFQN
jgi:hypothetical protein